MPLSAKRYLKTPVVFGLHGIYRLLARTLGIEAAGRLGEQGWELLRVWSDEQGLPGFVGSVGGAGEDWRRRLRDAVHDGLQEGCIARGPGWEGWRFFHDHLAVRGFRDREAKTVFSFLDGR